MAGVDKFFSCASYKFFSSQATVPFSSEIYSMSAGSSPDHVVADLSQETFKSAFASRNLLFGKETEEFAVEVVKSARARSIGGDDPTLVLFHHAGVNDAVRVAIRTELVNRGGIPSDAEPDRIISFRDLGELVDARNNMRTDTPNYFSLSNRLADQLGVPRQALTAETAVVSQTQRQIPDVASYQFFMID